MKNKKKITGWEKIEDTHICEHISKSGAKTPRKESQSSLCCLWRKELAAIERRKSQSQTVSAEANVEEGMAEVTRESSESANTGI